MGDKFVMFVHTGSGLSCLSLFWELTHPEEGIYGSLASQRLLLLDSKGNSEKVSFCIC